MFQTEKITRLAVAVFREGGQLYISGHGILKRVFLSAYLSENGQSILPPREHTYFNRQKQIAMDTILVRKVATYFILSEPEAIDMVRLWEEMVVQQARDRGMLFADFGIFRFEEHLDFEAETLHYYQHLPSVAYKPVGSDLHEFPFADMKPVHSLPAGNVPPRRRILVPALWIILVGLFGFAIYLWSGPLDKLLEHNSEINSRLVNVAPKSYSPGHIKEFYNDTDGVNKDGHTDSNESHNEMIDSGAGTQNVITAHLPEKNASIVGENELPVPDNSYEAAQSSVVLEESGEASPRCTLIVGAFANADNVDRMVHRLKGYNVEVVTVERSTLTLVGANIPCSNSTKMNTLRDQIDSAAWIYKK